MKKNNKKGFTIVELVIVIAVIGILAAVLIPTFGGIIDDAKEKAALQSATSAYKEAYAKALEDGVITNGSEQQSAGGYTFTFTETNGVITCNAVSDTVIDGYLVTCTNGVIKVEKSAGK